MRNKTMKASPFRWMLKRYVFLLVAVLLVSFAIFPMQGMMRVLSVSREMEYRGPMTASTRNYYVRDLTLNFVYSPLNLEILCVIFGAMGFGAALVLFRHLFSRKQGMLTAGLPVTRGRDFLLRTGVYLVTVLLPILLCMAVYPVLVGANGLRELFSLKIYAMRVGSVVLINLYGYTLGALCASLFSTVWSAALGGAVIAVSGEAVMACWVHMAGCYLHTLYQEGTIRHLARFFPAYTMYKYFYRPGEIGILPGIAAAALFGFLAFLAYRRVLPENAGHALNHRRAEPFVLGWAAVLGGTAGAMALTLYLSQEASLYAGLILGAFVAWIMAGMLVDQRIRADFRRWKAPAAVTAVMLIAFLGMRMDWTGFDAYAPDPERLEAVLVRPGMDENTEIRFGEPETVRASLDWTAQMREELLARRRETPFMSYVGPDAVLYFRGKDGSTVTRQYIYPEDPQTVQDALGVMAVSYQKQQGENLPGLPKANWYAGIYDFGLSAEEFRDTFGFYAERSGSYPIDAKKVREALRQDMQARTLATLQEPVLLRVAFEGINPETEEYDYSYRNYSVYPDDRNTLELILGDKAEQWTDYAMGGFARSGELIVFLCEYAENEEGEWVPVSWRRVESEEEVRTWMKEVVGDAPYFFGMATDPSRGLKVYSMPEMRETLEYGEELDVDLDDPETIARLPELEMFWGREYHFLRK